MRSGTPVATTAPLVVVHFANGAFTDWPDYRKLARRAWVDKVSGHDAYGKFIVGLAEKAHPITKGLSEYETTDELYYKQQGVLPVEVLLTARHPLGISVEMAVDAKFARVLTHSIEYPSYLSKEARTLVEAMLQRVPLLRPSSKSIEEQFSWARSNDTAPLYAHQPQHQQH